MMKKREDMSFEELVDFATQQIHSALLMGGGKGMRKEIFLWMANAIDWDRVPRKEKEGLIP